MQFVWTSGRRCAESVRADDSRTRLTHARNSGSRSPGRKSVRAFHTNSNDARPFNTGRQSVRSVYTGSRRTSHSGRSGTSRI